jgi:hypothetical protein
MGAGEIIIGLIIMIFFVAAGLMGLARPWEDEPEEEAGPTLSGTGPQE